MTLFPPRRHRGQRADGGFVLLEAIVSIALITIMMTALTTLFVSAMKVTNHQRLSQSAVRLATDSIDNARGLGWETLTKDPGMYASDSRTIANTKYDVVSTYFGCDSTSGDVGFAVDFTSCTEVTAAAEKKDFLQVRVSVGWKGADCAPGGCTYTTSVVLSTAQDPTFLAAAPWTTTSSTSTTTSATTSTSASGMPTAFVFSVPAHSVQIASNCGHVESLTDSLVQYVMGSSDPNNLTFQLISANLAGVSVDGTQLSIKEPCKRNAAAGSFQATVSVTDGGLGKTIQSIFAINVVTS